MKIGAWQTFEQLRKDLASGLFRLNQDNLRLQNNVFVKILSRTGRTQIDVFKLNTDDELVFADSANTDTTRDSLGLAIGSDVFAYDADLATFVANMDFSTSEVLTGRKWLGSPTYRKTISTGTLPNATTNTDAHGITGATQFVDIDGWASNGTTWIKLPHVSTGSNMVAISVDATNINTVTAANLTAFTTSYVTLEYIK